jgi:hypothetical protein
VQIEKLFQENKVQGLLLKKTPPDVFIRVLKLKKLENFIEVVKYLKPSTWKRSLDMFIRDIDGIIQKMPPTVSAFDTYRGSSYPISPDIDMYISTSLDPKQAFMFNPCMILYSIPPGSLVLPLLCVSRFFRELEILLPHKPASRQKITEHCPLPVMPNSGTRPQQRSSSIPTSPRPQQRSSGIPFRSTKIIPIPEYSDKGSGSVSAQASSVSLYHAPTFHPYKFYVESSPSSYGTLSSRDSQESYWVQLSSDQNRTPYSLAHTKIEHLG